MFDFSNIIGEFNMLICHLWKGMSRLLKGGRSLCDDFFSGVL